MLIRSRLLNPNFLQVPQRARLPSCSGTWEPGREKIHALNAPTSACCHCNEVGHRYCVDCLVFSEICQRRTTQWVRWDPWTEKSAPTWSFQFLTGLWGNNIQTMRQGKRVTYLPKHTHAVVHHQKVPKAKRRQTAWKHRSSLIKTEKVFGYKVTIKFHQSLSSFGIATRIKQREVEQCCIILVRMYTATVVHECLVC